MNRRAIEAYQLLGIPRDSDRGTITHAYRRLARTVHPDVSADADAAERFANLAEAYRIASMTPAHQAPVPTEVPVRRAGRWSRQNAPIVAGPVYIAPPSDPGERRRRG